MFGCLVELIIVVAILASMWKLFEKMGRQGWEGIIPIYNIIILSRLCGKPDWWFILFFIPIVNIVAAWILFALLAKDFDEGVGMTFLLVFLPFIGFPILGLGQAVYKPKPRIASTP